METPLERIQSRGPVRGRLALLGPAFVAAVAYVDPGNFATNVAAGGTFGYRLLWVVVMADVMAVLVQYLSAKLGLATGRNLAEVCRDRLPRPMVLGLWVQAEAVAIATDLAEFVGAALGLNLVFGLPLLPAGGVTAVVAFAVLACRERGYRPFELVVVGLAGFIALGFGYDLVAVGHQRPVGILRGLVPSEHGVGALLLTIGIVGATVMPHVVYLHSALTQQRIPADRRRERALLLRWLRLDCVFGLGAAGLVNAIMLCVATAALGRHPGDSVSTLEGAHAVLRDRVGGAAALAFAVALLAAGLSSSSVGTYAGQVVMQGFLRRRVSLFARRAVTMAPALLVLGVGVSPTRTLVLSQVVLSFGIPFALVPLVVVTARRDVMAELVNRRATTLAASVVTAVIVGLNGYLLVAAA